MDLERLADDWIRCCRSFDETLGTAVDFAAKEAVDDLVHEDPELGLNAIIAILERIDPTPADSVFQVLAAGPLEDLLAEHGPTIIDRVETEALQNERFNLLLGGVWPKRILPAVWSRVEKVRKEEW